jgi:hypothetical protein
MLRPVTFRAAAAAVSLTVVATAARAYDPKELFQDKFQLAEIFEGAAYAADKCPGLHVIEDNVEATADEAGGADEIDNPKWKFWESRGQMNARLGYEKNPTAWCESIWRFLGPDHPTMISRALLAKD